MWNSSRALLHKPLRVGWWALGVLLVCQSAAISEETVPSEIRDAAQVFIDRMIVVKGEGAAPSDRPLSAGQKQLLAKRAAKVIALRELAETLAGVRIAGTTSVEDIAAKSDVVRGAVDGVIKGAEVFSESYDPHSEIATVFVKLPLDGPSGVSERLRPQLVAGLPSAPAARAFAPSVAPSAPVEAADALIVDARGKDFHPAMINRIVAGNGEVLLEPSRIAPEILAKKGCGEYTNDVGKAKAILASHGARSPLVIVATGVQRDTDVEVSESDATAIFGANQKTNFLEAARVVFVL